MIKISHLFDFEIDISISNPILTDIITGLDHPFGIAFNGNDLYIAEVVGKKISKVNVTATVPILTDVITGLDFVYGLAFKGDELYFTERSLNKISKRCNIVCPADRGNKSETLKH